MAANSGVPSQPFLVEGSHTYAAAGNYHLVVFLQGPDDTSTSDQSANADVTGILQAISLPAGNQTLQGNSFATSTSADGRFSVFTSSSSNVILNQVRMNSTENVFLYDNVTNTTTLVNHVPGSTTTTGNGGVGFAPSNSFSARPPAWLTPLISADGSTIVFASLDSNLVSGMTGSPGGEYFIYLYNVATGQLSLVNHLPGQATTISGSALYPSISANGQDVAYLMGNTSSPTGYTVVSTQRYDRVADASVPLTFATSSGPVTTAGPSISDNGQYIAFENNGNSYVYSQSVGTSNLVSHTFASLGIPANSTADQAVISHDGTTIAFVSAGTNLVAGQVTSGFTNVFRYVVASGALTLVSGASGSGTTGGIGNSDSPAIGLDGSYIAYRSDAGNLVPGQSGATGNIFEYNVQAGTQTLVSAQTGSALVGAGGSSKPVIDNDGHLISYVSTAGNLVPNQTGTPGVKNIFIWLRQTGANILASGQNGSASAAGNADSDGPLLTRSSLPRVQQHGHRPSVGRHHRRQQRGLLQQPGPRATVGQHPLRQRAGRHLRGHAQHYGRGLRRGVSGADV